ncbi:hypothetical protein L2U69_03405 [Zavarzinia compransoris]|uniref:hypothetical protein n=1 Tax=Zavarzinia marina TaxID=2911065 RepID=UPI001F1BF7DC|nr:hypothetical protein [Zavarzinia marina]MCF4164689.1 hypothetical protein [Zavarzinia marina]
MAKDISKPIKTGWTDIVLVCGKCQRKMKGGFGPNGKQDLDKALSRALRPERKTEPTVGIVETRCLDVCPRGGVTVACSRDPGTMTVVMAGTPVERVIERLGLQAPLAATGS